MKIRLTRDLRLWHKTGEIVDLPEEIAKMLLISGAGEKVEKKKK